MRRVFLGVLLVLASFLSGSVVAWAQERSYSYDSIKFDFQVNPDTTVDVIERQTYNFTGEYHQGWRNIPLRGVSAITDIAVIDAATGNYLAYSPKRLEKTDPASWGKFTTFRQNGERVIEWYYNQANTSHGWLLKYRLHGALGFYADHDELYWNLFTDYQVPVARAEAKVILPTNQFDVAQLQITGYGEPVLPETRVLNPQTFFLSADNLPPGEKLTMAAGWPRGLVNRSLFWRDWLALNLFYLLSGLLVLLTILFSLGRWYILEYRPLHSKTVVPEYEPPRGLRPAMALVIEKEGVGAKAWVSTIVDLAVRGFIKIEEIEKKILFFTIKDYGLAKLRSLDGLDIAEYEKELVNTIFGEKDALVLSELRAQNRGRFNSQKFRFKMLKAKDQLLRETEGKAGAYRVGLVAEKKKAWFIPLLILVAIILTVFGVRLDSSGKLFGLVLFVCALWIYFERYEARLSPEGQQLKRDILGFKLYLQTAERYRLQNLTPDLFEKYLPYAMAFGVEKKWSQAFEGMVVPPPSWYVSQTAVSSNVLASAGTPGGFSAAAFSASFSSSFASSFSSSSGGASGGGGGVGGGGGGGGGGAS